MTVVECFDVDPIKNILSLATFEPSRIIFLTDASIGSQEKKRYADFAAECGVSCELIFKVTDTHKLSSLIDTLDAVTAASSDIAFDMTGGKEPMLAAVGVIYERYRHSKTIRLHRFDMETGDVFNALDDTPIPRDRMHLTIAQMIALYGGAIGGRTNGGTPTVWSFDDEFLRTLNVLWRINKDAPSRYNKTISQLREFEKYKDPSSPLRTVVRDDAVNRRIDRYREKREAITAFLNRLCKDGLVTLHGTDGCIDFSYKDAQTKKCLSKAGNLLEIKTLFAAMQIKDTTDKPLIGDALCGVHIDWDGHFVDSDSDTLNEIDVLLIKGLTPIFISCKNGTMDDKELYKLSTVAHRFGGDRGKAIVVATYIEKNPLVRASLLQRAEDMGIAVIADAHRLSDKDLTKAIQKAITSP